MSDDGDMSFKDMQLQACLDRDPHGEALRRWDLQAVDAPHHLRIRHLWCGIQDPKHKSNYLNALIIGYCPLTKSGAMRPVGDSRKPRRKEDTQDALAHSGD